LLGVLQGDGAKPKLPRLLQRHFIQSHDSAIYHRRTTARRVANQPGATIPAQLSMLTRHCIFRQKYCSIYSAPYTATGWFQRDLLACSLAVYND